MLYLGVILYQGVILLKICFQLEESLELLSLGARSHTVAKLMTQAWLSDENSVKNGSEKILLSQW